MGDSSGSGSALQREYYERTAHDYRRLHESEHSSHDEALKYIDAILPTLDARSILDVGAGTGRALRFFRDRRPAVELRGIEPVAELVREAELAGLPSGTIAIGDGRALPFGDGAVDVVTAFGVLHHVAEPREVIAEMTRVARKAIFISDANRFAQGRPLARYVKLAAHAAGLWPALNFVRTRGRRYMVSEGDGVYYSYSVFDSIRPLRAWATRLFFMELEQARDVAGPWASPLGNASSLLVGALRV